MDRPPVLGLDVTVHDPVVVLSAQVGVPGVRRLALFSSPAELAWAARLDPSRFPPRSCSYRIRTGEQLSFVPPKGYLQKPSSNAMCAPIHGGAVIED